jgi:3-hydroxyisobutyrate dehydrogenase
MTLFAFIGLGNMGSPMAYNLVEAGHTVRVFDLNPEAVQAAADFGAIPAESIADSVKGVDVAITMLPAGTQVRSVYNELWDHVYPNTLLIDSSTVDMETSRWCHDQAKQQGLRFVDAPVSGGLSGAKAATLVFMVGGNPLDVEEARTHLSPMARQIFAAGRPTAGAATKIVNNLMAHIHLLANAEGSQLAAKLGLDPKIFHEIVSASSGSSWVQQTWYPVPQIITTSAADNNFDATFRAELSAKDLSLAIDAAAEHNLNMPATQLVHGQIQALCAEGLGHKDCTLVTKYVNPDGRLDGYLPEE